MSGDDYSDVIAALREELPRFAAGFLTGDVEIDRNIQRKIDHTLRVADEAAALAAAENFTLPERATLLAAALEHDRSRFEQFRRFRTFRDSDSFNHGERSAELAAELAELHRFGETARRDIIFAIRVHNLAAVPEAPSPAAARLAAALRDVDKLDIVELLLNYLSAPEDRAVTFNLDETPEITPAIAEAMRSGETPRHSEMVHAVDFIAAKLLWGRDLGFAHSAREFIRRRYMERLLSYLPRTPLIMEVYERECRILERRAAR